jgi:hypothetical protein
VTFAPGIVLLGNGEPDDEHRIRAALLHGRQGALLTGIHAMRRRGLRRAPTPRDVHVLVPAERRVANLGFVHVERTTRLPRARILGGVPVVPVHRAVVDATRRLRDHDTVLAMMAEAVQRRRCTPSALAHELATGSRSGRAIPTQALAPLLDGAQSVAEADAWRLRRRSGLPECRWNVKLFGPDGQYVASPDAWWDDVGLAWEIDSVSHHTAPDDHAETLARNTRYLLAGVVVVPTLPVRLRSEPEQVLTELRAAYDIARGRPRPDVRVR